MARSTIKSRKSPSANGGTSASGKLVAKLANHIGESLIPGESEFEQERREEIAAHLLDSGRVRKPGEAAIRIDTATVPEDRRVMRIVVINDDMPFLVDSVSATLAEAGLVIDRLVHPVVAVRRNGNGELTDLPATGGEGETRESFLYFETPRVDARHRRALENELAAVLGDVRAAVTDWPRLREAMERDAASLADAEGAALLRWLGDGMMTMLGHITRQRDGSHSELLGICRRSARNLLADDSWNRAFAWFDKPSSEGGRNRGRVPLVIKANRASNVHRRVPLDLFIVPVMDGGKVTALSVHAGIWTSAALSAPPSRVPRLRQQLQHLMERYGFDPTSHDGKSLVHALTSLPHDLLTGFSDADIERVATSMMSLVDRPRPKLALIEAPLSRHLFAFVWLPRDLVSTAIRTQIASLLEEAANAPILEWSLQVEGGNLAMLRFVLDIREQDGPPDHAPIEERIQAMLRGWNEAVAGELKAYVESGRAAAIAQRFSDAFPAGYRAKYGAREAALDILRMRDLAIGDGADHERPARDARLFRLETDAADHLRLKIYQSEGHLPLSDAVPALENFGFRVLTEIPTALEDGALGTIHDFLLEMGDGGAASPLLDRAGAIEKAITAVLNREAEDDPFNRLVTGSGLDAGEADLLRAFYRYLRQVGVSFTIYTVVDALDRAPEVSLALISLMRALHDPDFTDDRDEAADAAREAIRKGLAKVNAINDDRLLRLYRSLVEAILRTNAFAPAGEEALAFKIASAEMPGLPRPVPWREIFVYSRRVEGIHLRAGPVARGGLRWSDRRDDFRTEVLGLMKAQRVKNAVIVPTGAKGGFYPKQLPDPAKDRDGWAAEGQASYEVFIRALLSVTDNIVDDKVIHPDRVVIRDGEDPYFVVAADKGTARFSDIANAIAENRGFWLDDAFASGGSKGYDHKAMGITARGAWISVQRHFLELGTDVQTESVRVAGCGDMSGDVFGNGMLLSKAIKLVAAFDHRHIFIDPDPDPAASWKERQRMFDLPRSSWEDYDKSLISRGGGVFSRSQKTIKLSTAARRVMGIEDKEIDPDSLISAILRAPVDLFWFGGIGTYIKAESENNVEVGDPANDTVRIDAAEVRARVIGEGANLGITQAGRIEFALGGGRINTDFIDNSAGVDCSDNEVNIKIALAAAKRAGKLTEKARVALLADMTEEVAELVLDDNRHQALALSIAESGGAKSTPSQVRLIEYLEDGGNLDRRTEGLAAGDVLSRRASEGQGLTRPELAVLLSSAKLMLQDAIEASDLPDDPGLERLLIEDFPKPMQAKFKPFLQSHRLRREIVATVLANRIVDRLGIVLPFELAEEEGCGLADVAAALVTAVRLFDVRALWERLESAEMEEPARLILFNRTAVALRSHMADLLRAGAATERPSAIEERLRPGVEALRDATDSLLAAESRHQSARLRAELAQSGAPDDLACEVSRLFDLDGAVGLAALAEKSGIPPRSLTAAFTDLGGRLGLDWAQGTAAMANPSDPWERLLVAGLARDFQQMRLDFLRRVARRKGAVENPVGAVEQWAEANAAPIKRFRAMINRAQGAGPVAPAMLAQIASQARNLLQR